MSGAIDLTDNPMEVPRYRELAYWIAVGKTQQEAMKLAGVGGHSTLSKVLRDERVLNYIQTIRKEQMDNLEITRDDVLRGFLSAIADAKTLGDPGSQIAGWREIGKFQGQYAPEEVNHKISGTVEHVTRRIRDLPDDRLLELLERAEAGENVIDLEDAEWNDVTPTQSASAANGASSSRPSAASPTPTAGGATRSAGPAGRKRSVKSSGSSATSGASRKRKPSGSRKPRSAAKTT